jgi:dienelactone hydrolase
MGRSERAGHFTIAAVASLVMVIAVGCSSGTDSRATDGGSTTTTSTSSTTTSTPPPNALRIADAVAPEGFAFPGATWLTITRPDGATQLAAVFRPPARADGNPVPVVVLLHGSSGLSKLQLASATKLAAAGFVVVVGCYLDADPISVRQSPGLFMGCPGVPDSEHSSLDQQTVAYSALLDAAQGLTGVAPDQVATVGVSQGAIVAVSVNDPRVKAIVADSGYRKTGGNEDAPVLLLGMTTDPNVDHARIVHFEETQRAAGQPIEVQYYPGTGHVTLYQPVADDAMNRVITFLHQHLG